MTNVTFQFLKVKASDFVMVSVSNIIGQTQWYKSVCVYYNGTDTETLHDAI